jgi:hypothetical protein
MGSNGHIPPLPLGRMRRGAEAGPAACYCVQRPWATKRGIMRGRYGEQLHSVHLPGLLRQGVERHHD